MPASPSRRVELVTLLIALAVVCAVHFTSIPLTIWEYDESLFAMAVEHYQPLLHQPPPPGYPLYIGFTKLLLPLFAPFDALIAVSILGVLGGFIAFALAFRVVSGSGRSGTIGAFLFYFSPAMLIHATLPQSDSGALALLAVALWLTGRAIDDPSPHAAALAAIACAFTIGWRLQFAIAVVPMFGVAVLMLRTWRARAMAVQWFAIGCAAWLVPLIVLTGGPESFWRWLSGQAAYFAQHDADLSRSGQTAGGIALHFIAHPWGPKWLAAPVLLLALVGIIDGVRRRRRLVLPVATMVIVYLAFALLMMDPADGVRYALPSVAGVALLATLGLQWLRTLTRGVLADWAIVLLYACGAWFYCAPLLRQRAETASPPMSAVLYLRSVAPRNAVILHDLALKPHAIHLLRGFALMRVDEGLMRFGHRTDVPLYELTNGAVETPGAKVFRWTTGDAYTKLTRGHYGATSVVPLAPAQRFLAVAGLSAPERAKSGSWRWIGERGVIELPDIGASHVRLTFATPEDYAFDANSLLVAIAGQPPVRVKVGRGATVPVELAVPQNARTRIELTPERWFVPADIPGRRSRDRRHLSIMLVGVEQVGHAAGR